MDERQITRKKRGNPLAVSNLILTVAVLLLASVLVFTWLKDRREEEEQQAMEVMAQLKAEEAANEELEAFLSRFKTIADEYVPGTEFMQRLFPDKIVYRHNGKYVYEEIDSTVPQNDYDWENFISSNGERYYVDENGNRSQKGIDVSKYQGDIDWEKVAADGVDFAMIRVGYRGYGTGTLVEDEYFKQNVQGALDAGVDVGVYFYTQAINTEEAVEEAEFVLQLISGYDIAYPVAIDTEAVDSSSRTDQMTAEERTNVCKAFYDRISEAGYNAMIYTNINWLMTNLDPTALGDYDKWLAVYWSAPIFPYKFQMWQYTASGKVDGIEGNVDMNAGLFDYGKIG